MPKAKNNGYAQVDNNILEALSRYKLTSYELRIVLAIIRKTLGWHKDSDIISHSQLRQLTGIDERNIVRTIKKLTEKNILEKQVLHQYKVSYSLLPVSKWLCTYRHN